MTMPSTRPADPVRLPRSPRRPLLEFALPVTALASGTMLGLAVPAILDAITFADHAKALLLAISGTAVSYTTTKLAIDKGADYGTTGFHGATILSVGSIIAVGAGLFGATYSGLTLRDTDALMQQEHGREMSAYVGARSAAASHSASISAAVISAEADIAEKLACEIAISCISGYKAGGTGPAARILQAQLGRASSISKQLTAAEAARSAVVQRLNVELAAYQTTQADDAIDARERRAKLQTIDARMHQAVGALDAVVPFGLISAYANELSSGASLPGRPEAEARLNAVLTRHGTTLSSVIAATPKPKTAVPSFPSRASVSDTFRYITRFLPIAAVVAVVELVLPIVMWAYAFWGLAWQKHKDELSPSKPKNNDHDRDAPLTSKSDVVQVITPAHVNNRTARADAEALFSTLNVHVPFGIENDGQSENRRIGHENPRGRDVR